MSVEKFIRKEVRDAPAYHLETHQGIKLNQNESPWDIPVELKTEIIEELLKTPWNRYPLNDIVSLKKKLSKKLNLWPDNLVFANGSNVLIQAIIMATSINGKIMVCDPTFSVYEIQGQILGNQIIKFPLEADFSINTDACLKLIKKEKPKVIFIANPNAPTGNLFSLNVLRSIIEASPGLVVIDEAYYPFSGSTVISWLRQYDNLAIIRTFSKAYALGGLRFGWLATEAEMAREIEKCLLPFCLSKLSLVAVEAILNNSEYVDEYAEAICNERDRVFEAMQKIDTIITYPTKANFILFRTPDSKLFFKRLVDGGVIVRDVSSSFNLENCLRVSIGSPEENDQFLKILAHIK